MIAPDSTDEGDFILQWERWHQEHEQRRASPLGFLAITGLHWLSDQPARFDDVPGSWSSDSDGVNVQLDVGEDLIVAEQHVSGRYRFLDVDERGVRARFGDAIVEVARRGNLFMIRPRDPTNSVRTRYAGTPTYPASTEWIAKGTFHPYDETQSVHVGASVEGLTQVYESRGEIEFELANQVLRLVAFQDDDPQELFIVFTDQTAGSTTYRACRFLSADAPDAEGHVVLDFNRATNPPCAYSDFATCPLPPARNQLPIRVEAGERVR
jgi:uncharacterized protein (DUF1684 family)